MSDGGPIGGYITGDITPRLSLAGATEAVIAKRVECALDLLRVQRMRYTKALAEHMRLCDVSKATACRDFARAYEIIAEDLKKNLPAISAEIVGELWGMYEEARAIEPITETKDGTTRIVAIPVESRKLAKDILKEIAKLHGAYAPTRVKVEGGTTEDEQALLAALKMSPIERRKRMAELEKVAEAESKAEMEEQAIDAEAQEVTE